MHRSLRWAGAALLVLGLSAPAARAQFGYMYPGGYGGYGWGGWGGGTIAGDAARGMGMFAAGVGQYNVNTAQAASINTDTVMRWNSYIAESQRQINIAHAVRRAQESDKLNTSRDVIYKRLRDNPDTRDIASGDALNVAFDQITAPGVYAASMKEGQTGIPSTLIKDIPFNKASEGISVSLNELLNPNNWPDQLKIPAFDGARAKLRAAANQVRAEDDAGEIKPESYTALTNALKDFRDVVYERYPNNSRERNIVNPYLKGLAGLTRMLDQPRIRELIKNVDETETRSVSDLLNFMLAFSLRFGPAQTPRERAVYLQLYPAIDKLRDAVAKPETDMPIANAAGSTSNVTDFFGRMDDKHLKVAAPNPIPSVPTHKPAAPPAPKNP